LWPDAKLLEIGGVIEADQKNIAGDKGRYAA
jgi:hypothetical protein